MLASEDLADRHTRVGGLYDRTMVFGRNLKYQRQWLAFFYYYLIVVATAFVIFVKNRCNVFNIIKNLSAESKILTN